MSNFKFVAAVKEPILRAASAILMLGFILISHSAAAQANVSALSPVSESTSASSRTVAVDNISLPSIPSSMQLPDLTKRENVSSALQIVILMTVLSMVPVQGAQPSERYRFPPFEK